MPNGVSRSCRKKRWNRRRGARRARATGSSGQHVSQCQCQCQRAIRINTYHISWPCSNSHRGACEAAERRRPASPFDSSRLALGIAAGPRLARHASSPPPAASCPRAELDYHAREPTAPDGHVGRVRDDDDRGPADREAWLGISRVRVQGARGAKPR